MCQGMALKKPVVIQPESKEVLMLGWELGLCEPSCVCDIDVIPITFGVNSHL